MPLLLLNRCPLGARRWIRLLSPLATVTLVNDVDEVCARLQRGEHVSGIIVCGPAADEAVRFRRELSVRCPSLLSRITVVDDHVASTSAARVSAVLRSAARG